MYQETILHAVYTDSTIAEIMNIQLQNGLNYIYDAWEDWCADKEDEEDEQQEKKEADDNESPFLTDEEIANRDRIRKEEYAQKIEKLHRSHQKAEEETLEEYLTNLAINAESEASYPPVIEMYPTEDGVYEDDKNHRDMVNAFNYTKFDKSENEDEEDNNNKTIDSDEEEDDHAKEKIESVLRHVKVIRQASDELSLLVHSKFALEVNRELQIMVDGLLMGIKQQTTAFKMTSLTDKIKQIYSEV